jgi:predicted MFS family arabinose efflux permease
MVPSLMGAVLTHVRPEQAGAAAGVLTTTQQFAIACGVAIVGAVFYQVIGGAPTRASFVSGLEVVTWIDAGLLVIAAGLTFLLPRPGRPVRR